MEVTGAVACAPAAACAYAVDVVVVVAAGVVANAAAACAYAAAVAAAVDVAAAGVDDVVVVTAAAAAAADVVVVGGVGAGVGGPCPWALGWLWGCPAGPFQSRQACHSQLESPAACLQVPYLHRETIRIRD